MKLLVDGVIYERQQRGGISRLFSELLPRLCALDDSLRIFLNHEDGLKQALPVHERIHQRALPPVASRLGRHVSWTPLASQIRRCFLSTPHALASDAIWHSTYFTRPWAAWRGKRVVTVYDMVYERFPDLYVHSGPYWRARKARCLEDADAILCISAATRRDVVDVYDIDPARLFVVPLAPSDVFLTENAPEEERASCEPGPYLLYVGGRYKHKNVPLLLNSYARWAKRTDVRLLFVGGGPWSDAETRLLRDLDIETSVRHVGYVDDETLKILYREAIALVYPSLYEGFGIPLLEAMVSGCPIVASRIPSTVEIAEDVPIYFEPDHAESLILALNRVVEEGVFEDRLRRGVLRAKEFSWEKTARKTLAVYRSMLA